MDEVLASLLTLVGVVGVGLHAWAGKGHFASPKMPRGAILVSLAVIAATLADLFLTWWGELWAPAVVVGVALELFGLLLFWRAIVASREARLLFAFDENLPHNIVRQGPYRFVRHPFYTSYLLFWIGWAVAIWSAWALIPLAVIVAVYAGAAIGEERKFARTPMAADYAAYRQKTGMFWPVPAALGKNKRAP